MWPEYISIHSYINQEVKCCAFELCQVFISIRDVLQSDAQTYAAASIAVLVSYSKHTVLELIY